MRSVVLYIAASLDHFIACPDGDIDWLHAPEYAIPGEIPPSCQTYATGLV